MSAPKKSPHNPEIDPALVPFLDALAELLAADALRDRASKADAALEAGSEAIEILESDVALTRTDRACLVALIRFLTRSYWSRSKPAYKGQRRPAHRPAGESESARMVEAVAWLVDRYGIPPKDAIRAVEPATALSGNTEYAKLRKAYGRFRARRGKPDPRRIVEWLDARRAPK